MRQIVLRKVGGGAIILCSFHSPASVFHPLQRVPSMRVLLFSMPDSFEHTPPVTMRMPNGALASLAGNVDPHHEVAIADLVLARDRVPETVTDLVARHAPDVVGLSIMTFQRKTALRVIA